VLVSFTVQNYGSIYEPITIDLVKDRATWKKSQTIDKRDLLPVFGIYGANASGKSTLLQAFNFLVRFVLGRMGIRNKGDRIPYNPFVFADEAMKTPSVFTVEFVANKILYEYTIACDADMVVYEHLYNWPKGRKALVFKREKQKFTFVGADSEKQQRPLAERTLENRPYLYTSNEWNLSLTEDAFLWFRNVPAIDLKGIGWMGPTFKDLESSKWRTMILEELKYADFGISDIIKEPEDEKDVLTIPLKGLDPELRAAMGIPDNIGNEGKVKFGRTDRRKVQTVHCVNGKTVYLGLEKESDGTNKYLSLMSGILRALEEGRVLLIDEFEASLHPLLVRHIVELFQDPERNTGGGQLVFVSHNTTLLDLDLLERCQIGFVEKDPDSGATDLYTLDDIKGVRNNENISKGYLQGRYGAIPFMT